MVKQLVELFMTDPSIQLATFLVALTIYGAVKSYRSTLNKEV